jgi:hypothetical protein
VAIQRWINEIGDHDVFSALAIFIFLIVCRYFNFNGIICRWGEEEDECGGRRKVSQRRRVSEYSISLMKFSKVFEEEKEKEGLITVVFD